MLHGGSLSLQSQLGVDTIVTVRLPADRAYYQSRACWREHRVHFIVFPQQIISGEIRLCVSTQSPF